MIHLSKVAMAKRSYGLWSKTMSVFVGVATACLVTSLYSSEPSPNLPLRLRAGGRQTAAKEQGDRDSRAKQVADVGIAERGFCEDGCADQGGSCIWNGIPLFVLPDSSTSFDASCAGLTPDSWSISGCTVGGMEPSNCCVNCKSLEDPGAQASQSSRFLTWSFCDLGRYSVTATQSSDGSSATVEVEVISDPLASDLWFLPWLTGSPTAVYPFFFFKPAYLNQFGDSFCPHDPVETRAPLGPIGDPSSGRGGRALDLCTVRQKEPFGRLPSGDEVLDYSFGKHDSAFNDVLTDLRFDETGQVCINLAALGAGQSDAVSWPEPYNTGGPGSEWEWFSSPTILLYDRACNDASPSCGLPPYSTCAPYPGVCMAAPLPCETCFDVEAGHTYDLWVMFGVEEFGSDVARANLGTHADYPGIRVSSLHVPATGERMIDGPDIAADTSAFQLNRYDGALDIGGPPVEQVRGDIRYYELEIPPTAIGSLRVQSQVLDLGTPACSALDPTLIDCPACRYVEVVILNENGDPVAWNVGSFDESGLWQLHIQNFDTGTALDPRTECDGELSNFWNGFCPGFTATVESPEPQARYTVRVGPEWAVDCVEMRPNAPQCLPGIPDACDPGVNDPGRPFTCAACENEGSIQLGGRVEVDPVAFDIALLDAPRPFVTGDPSPTKSEGQILAHFGLQNTSLGAVFNISIDIQELDAQTGEISRVETPADESRVFPFRGFKLPRTDRNADGIIDETEAKESGIVCFGNWEPEPPLVCSNRLEPIRFKAKAPNNFVALLVDSNDDSELDLTNNSYELQLPFHYPRIDTVSFEHDDIANGSLMVGRFIAFGQVIQNPTTMLLSDLDDLQPEVIGGVWQKRVGPELVASSLADTGINTLTVPMGGGDPVDTLEFTVEDNAGFKSTRPVSVHTVELPGWLEEEILCVGDLIGGEVAGTQPEFAQNMEFELSFDVLRNLFKLRFKFDAVRLDTNLKELTGWNDIPLGGKPLSRSVALEFRTEVPINEVSDLSCELELCSERSLFGWETSDCRELLNDPGWIPWEFGLFRIDLQNACLDWDSLDGDYDIGVRTELSPPLHIAEIFKIRLFMACYPPLCASVDYILSVDIDAATETNIRLVPTLSSEVISIVDPSQIRFGPGVDNAIRGTGSIFGFPLVKIDGYFRIGIDVIANHRGTVIGIPCIDEEHDVEWDWGVGASARLGIRACINTYVFGCWNVFDFSKRWNLTGGNVAGGLDEFGPARSIPLVEPDPVIDIAPSGLGLLLSSRDSDPNVGTALREMCARVRPAGSAVFGPEVPLTGWNTGLSHPSLKCDGLGGAVATFLGSALDPLETPTNVNVLSSTEVAYAFLDGTSWGPVQRLTSDQLSDSPPELGLSNNGWGAAVWTKVTEQIASVDFTLGAADPYSNTTEVVLASIRKPNHWVPFRTFGGVPATGGALNAVWESPDTVIFAVGNEGMVVRIEKGMAEVVTVAGGAPGSFRSVWGTDRANVLAVNSNGEIWHFDGKTWVLDYVTAGGVSLNGIDGANVNHAVAVGTGGLVVTFDGKEWSESNIGAPVNLLDVATTSISLTIAIGENGVIRKWDGNGWTSITSGTSVAFRGIWALGDGSYRVVGDGGSFVEVNGDKVTALSSGTTADLFDVSGSGDGATMYLVGASGTIVHVTAGSSHHMGGVSPGDVRGIWTNAAGDSLAVATDGSVLRHRAQDFTPRLITQDTRADRFPAVVFPQSVAQGEAGLVTWFTRIEEVPQDLWELRIATLSPWGDIDTPKTAWTLPPGDAPGDLAVEYISAGRAVIAMAVDSGDSATPASYLSLGLFDLDTKSFVRSPTRIGDGTAHSRLSFECTQPSEVILVWEGNTNRTTAFLQTISHDENSDELMFSAIRNANTDETMTIRAPGVAYDPAAMLVAGTAPPSITFVSEMMLQDDYLCFLREFFGEPLCTESLCCSGEGAPGTIAAAAPSSVGIASFVLAADFAVVNAYAVDETPNSFEATEITVVIQNVGLGDGTPTRVSMLARSQASGVESLVENVVLPNIRVGETIEVNLPFTPFHGISDITVRVESDDEPGNDERTLIVNATSMVSLSMDLPESYREGEAVVVTARIAEITGENPGDLRVRFYNGDPDDLATVQLGVDQLVTTLSGNDEVFVSQTWTALAGVHRLFVEAESISGGTSFVEGDGRALVQARVLPNLLVESINASSSVDSTETEALVTIEAVVGNMASNGLSSSGATLVQLFASSESQAETLVATAGVLSLQPGEVSTHTFNFSQPAGASTYRLAIDSNGSILEHDETDNEAIVVHTIAGVPDLLVRNKDLSLSVTNPVKGQIVGVRAVISNIGDWPACDVEVSATVGRRTYRRRFPYIGAGATETLVVPWVTSSFEGDQEILVTAVVLGPIQESNELNNAGTLHAQVLDPAAVPPAIVAYKADRGVADTSGFKTLDIEFNENMLLDASALTLTREFGGARNDIDLTDPTLVSFNWSPFTKRATLLFYPEDDARRMDDPGDYVLRLGSNEIADQSGDRLADSDSNPGDGSITLETVVVATCGCPFDLDSNCNVSAGDLALLAPCWDCSDDTVCWGQNLCESIDFDCNGRVHGGDLGWFAGAWDKECPKLSSANFPACKSCTGAVGCISPSPGGSVANVQSEPTVNIVSVVRTRQTGAREVRVPRPQGSQIFDRGDTVFVEIWIRDTAVTSRGLTSAYVDVRIPLSDFDVVDVEPGEFDILARREWRDGNDVYRDVGGSTLSEHIADESWALVAVITARAIRDDVRMRVEMQTREGEAIARFGVGLVAPTDVTVQNISIGKRPNPRAGERRSD